MKVYAVRDIAGYERYDKVKVYDIYTNYDNGQVMFLVWSPKLEKWMWIGAEMFVPYLAWLEDDDERD